MLDFKEKRAVHTPEVLPEQDSRKPIVAPMLYKLNEVNPGWYEGSLDFKRVIMIPGTGKFQYKDTHFSARCKAQSGLDCYNRIIDHLRERVDERSQFPSAKGKNFTYCYLGMWK
jgi:hypothetical protein